MPTAARVFLYTRMTKRNYQLGVFSDHDGAFKTEWTVGEKDKKTKFQRPLDEANFNFLWNGILEFPIFKRFALPPKNAKVDLHKIHGLQVTVLQTGKITDEFYGIPVGETHPDFEEWLRRIDVPFADASSSSILDKSGQFLKYTS